LEPLPRKDLRTSIESQLSVCQHCSSRTSSTLAERVRICHDNNHFTEMCSGSEAGSYLRLIDSCITQLKAQGSSRTSSLISSTRAESVRICGIKPPCSGSCFVLTLAGIRRLVVHIKEIGKVDLPPLPSSRESGSATQPVVCLSTFGDKYPQKTHKWLQDRIWDDPRRACCGTTGVPRS